MQLTLDYQVVLNGYMFITLSPYLF